MQQLKNRSICRLEFISYKRKRHTHITFSASYTYKSTCGVRVRRPPTVLDFLYVVHVCEVQMYEFAVFRWAYYHRWRFKSICVFTRDKLFYILIFCIKHVKKAKLRNVEDCRYVATWYKMHRWLKWLPLKIVCNY